MADTGKTMVIMDKDGKVHKTNDDFLAANGAKWVMLPPQVPVDVLESVKKDFTDFVNYDYCRFHVRATEIEEFDESVITWLTNQVNQREGWTISFMEAFCHPCITISKSTKVGEIMVKCY